MGTPARVEHQRRTKGRASKIPEALRWCDEEGADVATLWVLAIKNLRRHSEELAHLFRTLTDLVKHLMTGQRWKIRPIGFLDMLPDAVGEAWRDAQANTAHLDGLEANIAIAYDGKLEIIHAARQLAETYNPHATAELEPYLFTSGQPDCDLLVRTSGEERLSSFLTWQAAQAELHFTDKCWPDFTRADFARALDDYAPGNRRPGA